MPTLWKIMFEGSKYWMGVFVSSWALSLTFYISSWWAILQEAAMWQLIMVVALKGMYLVWSSILKKNNSLFN